MNAVELAEHLLSEYGIGTPNKSGVKAKISAVTLRKWANQGLISRTWIHDGKKGRPRCEFPKRAVAEAAALWAIKSMKHLKVFPPTKEEFNRFLDLVGLVYSIYNTGARLALHDVETKKGFDSIYVPFGAATVNASPVLNKLLVAKVVIILEKAKREWPLKEAAKVTFTWSLDTVRRTYSMRGKPTVGIVPTFTRIDVDLEKAQRDQFVYYVKPCELWPTGKTVITITDDDIIIEPHPLFELLGLPTL